MHLPISLFSHCFRENMFQQFLFLISTRQFYPGDAGVTEGVEFPANGPAETKLYGPHKSCKLAQKPLLSRPVSKVCALREWTFHGRGKSIVFSNEIRKYTHKAHPPPPSSTSHSIGVNRYGRSGTWVAVSIIGKAIRMMCQESPPRIMETNVTYVRKRKLHRPVDPYQQQSVALQNS